MEMPSIKAVGMTFVHIPLLYVGVAGVHAGLKASTVVPFGPGTVGAPGVDVATNCWRAVGSEPGTKPPLNGL